MNNYLPSDKSVSKHPLTSHVSSPTDPTLDRFYRSSDQKPQAPSNVSQDRTGVRES